MSAKPQITRFPRPPKTLIDSRVPLLNVEMERELDQARLLDLAARETDAEIRAGADGLSQLLDPQGRRNTICIEGNHETCLPLCTTCGKCPDHCNCEEAAREEQDMLDAAAGMSFATRSLEEVLKPEPERAA
jgi:hypothetical protein